ncbi:MAG: hypothetical protein AAF152_18200 [Cyanobacteria bacterium P01_A01_bin.114]
MIFSKRYTAFLGFSTLVMGLGGPAIAQPDGLSGSYAGSNLSVDEAIFSGLESTETPSLSEALMGVVLTPEVTQQYQGRLDIENSALSLRGALYVDPETRAVIPSVTYDQPVMAGTNVYAGAGYAVVQSGSTPVGDRNGLVLSAGAETELLPGTVVYGDAKLGVGTDSVTGNSPVRLQLGVGRRF